MLTDIAKKLRAALLSATVAMACAGQAQAAAFVGTWDPAFGSPFTALGWEGEVTFTIPDACMVLVTNQPIINNSDSCSQGQMNLTSAIVRLYALNDSTPLIRETLSTLTFTGLSLDEMYIYIDIADGQVNGRNTVTGLKADYNEWVQQVGSPTVPTIAGWPDKDLYFSLSFQGNCARLVYADNNQGLGGSPSDKCDASGESFLRIRELGLISTVPEPGSLALLLPAVGMLAALRRRRSASAA